MSEVAKMVNRQEHNEHYTMIDNAVLHNVNLSWEARGFLAFEHAPIQTAKGETDTRHPTNTPETVHSPKMPRVETATSGDIHIVEKPESGKPESGISRVRKNEPLLNTNKYQGLNIQRTNVKENIQKKFVPPTLEEVQAYCEERNNGIDPEAVRRDIVSPLRSTTKSTGMKC